MRYYSIKLTNPSGQVVSFDQASGKFKASGAPATWSSHDVAGNFIPSALNIELDIPSLPFGASQGGASMRVWGVGLPTLGQANDLAGYGIEVAGGMKAPYTLNKNAAPGPILSGQVFQGFGNWEGLSQYLDLVVFSQAADPDLAATIAFSWPANQPLQTAITNALTAAFPGFQVSGSVKNIIQDHDENGYYTDLKSFSESILSITASGAYTGINIRAVGQVFYLYDNSATTTPIPISFQDLIGQPTWISASTVTFASVMRADIQIGQAIKFPAGLVPPYVLTTPAAAVPNSPASSRSVFQGAFNVTEVHHYGNFRQPDSESWRTVYVAVPNTDVPNLISGQPTIPGGLA